jgi:hypothetical protein
MNKEKSGWGSRLLRTLFVSNAAYDVLVEMNESQV